ncbi:MAG TPA: hypothetical protein VGF97_08135 [Rhizomicrobium sp.]|jgi:hypothetical protein
MTDGTRRIVGLYWLAVALSCLSAVYAVICARDLIYDGSYYLLRTAEHARFQLVIPARALPQALQQCFAILGERAGIRDLFALARLMSLGMSGWPIVLTAACWFVLPRAEKAWIVGPLFNLALVIPTANLIGVDEGIIASCVLWLLFFVFTFRMQSIAGGVGALALTVACAFTHETAFPFMAGLSLIAAWRARRTSGWERVALIAIAIVGLAATLHLLSWVVFPRDPLERAGFLYSNLQFKFIGTALEPNLPFLASAAAILALTATWIQGRRGVASWPVWFAWIAFAFVVISMVLHPDRMIAPWRNFACRGFPVMFTTVAALAILFLRSRAISPARFATVPAAAILLGLMLTQTVLQFAMTERWQAFTNDLSHLVSERSGEISFVESSRALNPDATQFRGELLMTWGVQPLSIVLAPGGQVRAVVQPGPKAQWHPYRLDGSGTFPQAPGLDWSHFGNP